MGQNKYHVMLNVRMIPVWQEMSECLSNRISEYIYIYMAKMLQNHLMINIWLKAQQLG